jgi:L-ascorbate metabolism protein UlaG (beta-lactamase superfamily)
MITFFTAIAPAADTIETSEGDLVIKCVGHASLMMEFKGMVIHIDPFSRAGDYTKFPKGDLVLCTHHHGDHLDLGAIESIKKEGTIIVLTELGSKKLSDGLIMKNGDVKTVKGLKIEAVPAYNIKHQRSEGKPYHPKGEGNGYVVTFGDKRVYIAGDTENIPEMKNLGAIDVAFLPVNTPYTMDGEMAKAAALSFKPKIVYPYHFQFGQSQLEQFQTLMKNVEGIEIRVRSE